MAEVIVVGAGVSGLSVSAGLADAGHAVTVIDRVPVSGGVLGYDDPAVKRLHQRATGGRVSFLLGETVIRWIERRALVVGPIGIRWIDADHLVVCTGVRPRTQAEHVIVGNRLAGVLPVTAAVHLLESGASLGARGVVIGGGWWTDRFVHHTPASSAITVIGPSGKTSAPPGVRYWNGWSPSRVLGNERVTGVVVSRDHASELISCDHLVLAQTDIAYRNIDGAIREYADDVTYVQPLTGNADAVQAAATAQTTQIVDTLKDLS